MKIAYTAGPMRAFTIGGVHYSWDHNIDVGRRAHDAALKAGWFAVCPHLLSGHDQYSEVLAPEEYLERDLEFIRMVRPDIILLPRWRYSTGAKQEYELGIELGLNLYLYDEDDDAIVPGVVVGTGNVFADLGIPNAGDMLVKAELLSQVNNTIHSKRLSVQEAAVVLGTGSNDLILLMRGVTINIYSQEQLQQYLNVLTNIEPLHED